MFITEAFAQSAGSGGGANPLMQLLPFILIFIVMWFLIIRPQQKRMQEHKDMVAALRKGDTVVTAGGIIAKVTRIHSDTEIEVDIGDGVKVKLVRGTISDVRSKGNPV